MDCPSGARKIGGMTQYLGRERLFQNKEEQNNLVPIQFDVCPLPFRLTAFVLLQPTLYMCSPF